MVVHYKYIVALKQVVSSKYIVLPFIGWFLTFRWFLMLSVIFQYIAVFHMIIMIFKNKNGEPRQFWIPCLISLCSGKWNFACYV